MSCASLPRKTLLFEGANGLMMVWGDHWMIRAKYMKGITIGPSRVCAVG